MEERIRRGARIVQAGPEHIHRGCYCGTKSNRGACDQSRHAGSNLHHSSGPRTERRRSCPPGGTTRQEATKMKTEFAPVAPGSSNNPPRVRRDRSRPVVLVGLLLLIGGFVFVVRPLSHRSPTIDILGSYFPAWMICIVSGLTLTLISRWIIRAYHLEGYA